MLQAICSLPDNCFKIKPNGDRIFVFGISKASQSYRDQLVLRCCSAPEASLKIDLDCFPITKLSMIKDNKWPRDKFNYTREWEITITKEEFAQYKSEAIADPKYRPPESRYYASYSFSSRG